MQSLPIGQRYIEFLHQFEEESNLQKVESLFSPSVQKIVNSLVICSNRNQLIQQMYDVTKTYGTKEIHLLEIITYSDNKTHVVRFEMVWHDNTVECVIAILKCNESGLIEEINEVFGEKEAYQWNMQN